MAKAKAKAKISSKARYMKALALMVRMSEVSIKITCNVCGKSLEELGLDGYDWYQSINLCDSCREPVCILCDKGIECNLCPGCILLSE